MSYITVLTTTNSMKNAREIAKTLVEGKLSACVNIIDKVRSVYFYNDKLNEDKEILLIVKTRKELFEEVKDSILAVHEYELPEVIAFNIETGFDEYLNWIDKNTNE